MRLGRAAALRRLPKAELHVHLDGSLRPATMLELAGERGVDMPGTTPEELGRHMVVSDASNLEEYLQRFEITLSIMQDADALERVAYELVVDHAGEGVRYVEIRFCPLLNTEGDLSTDQVLDATLAGVRRAEAEEDIVCGVIVCGLRSHTPAQTLAMAELAIAYRRRGVCGYDLAGAEAGNPVDAHREAFDRTARADLPITIHAGEGYGPASIRQALELGHARRLGHGTRLHEDRELLETVRERGIPLEVCLTSNVQTRVVRSYAGHPMLSYVRDAVPVTLGTDNRLMSGVTLTGEYARALEALDSWTELMRIARTGFEHAFVDAETRAAMLTHFDEVAATLEGQAG